MDKDYLLKAIAYKAKHRGSKECDLIIGSFVNAYVAQNPEDTKALALLLSFIDRDDLSVFQDPTTSPPEHKDMALRFAAHQASLQLESR